jgi:hypothetical protein
LFPVSFTDSFFHLFQFFIGKEPEVGGPLVIGDAAIVLKTQLNKKID